MTTPAGTPGSRSLPQDTMLLAPAICCCGFFTFVPFLVMGVRGGRRAWKVAAAVYGAGAVVGILVMTIFDSGNTEGQPLGGSTTQSLATPAKLSPGESIGAWILIAVWIAGMIHAFIVREDWRKLRTAHGPDSSGQVGAANWPPFPAAPAVGPRTRDEIYGSAPTARLEPPPPPRQSDPTIHLDLPRVHASPVGSEEETVVDRMRPTAATEPGTGTDRTADGSILPAPDSAEISSTVEAHAYLPGESIGGRFEVEEVLGSGGFSRVYRVRDVVEDEIRALKLFNNAAGYDAVRREISALRKIDHPNVVKVFWAERTEAGEWYLVMEYLDGVPLDEYATGGKQLRDREAIDVALEVLSALVAIHPDSERLEALDRKKRDGDLSGEEYDELTGLSDNALVHRDIKPNNIILTRSGAKLLDFNIASRVGDRVRTYSGTPPYRPPDADVTHWDVSTDLFAMGVTLYELVCDGQHPYPQSRPTPDAEPRDPRQFRKDLDPSLSRFLLKACANDRSERFATAAQMRAALDSIRTSP